MFGRLCPAIPLTSSPSYESHLIKAEKRMQDTCSSHSLPVLDNEWIGDPEGEGVAQGGTGLRIPGWGLVGRSSHQAVEKKRTPPQNQFQTGFFTVFSLDEILYMQSKAHKH